MATADRGFGSMSTDRVREIASKGGRRAHETGVAYEWSSAEAREAGKKGGRASAVAKARRRALEHAAQG